MKTQWKTKIILRGVSLLILMPGFYIICYSQPQDSIAVQKNYALSTLGLTFGIGILDLHNWQTFMENFEQTIPYVTDTHYNNLSYQFDLLLNVRVHPHMAVGMHFQGLYTKMEFEYYDGPNNIFNYLLQQDRKK